MQSLSVCQKCQLKAPSILFGGAFNWHTHKGDIVCKVYIVPINRIRTRTGITLTWHGHKLPPAVFADDLAAAIENDKILIQKEEVCFFKYCSFSIK